MALSARHSERLRERYADKENAGAGPSDNTGKPRRTNIDHFMTKNKVLTVAGPCYSFVGARLAPHFRLWALRHVVQSS